MMNNMRGGDDLPDVDEAEDVRIIYLYTLSLHIKLMFTNEK